MQRAGFFFQAEDGIRDLTVTGVQTCALPISTRRPKAVVTSASEIPPATADRPVALFAAMPLNAFKIPTTVPKRPTKGAVEPMVASAERPRSEEHTSELQSQSNLVCRLLLEKKKNHELH